MPSLPSPTSVTGLAVAQLRVYEPLAAFAEPDRSRWAAYAASGGAPSTADGPALERAAGLAALLRPGTVPQVEEHAYVMEVDGVTLVCPWDSRLRALTALVRARAELPDVLVDEVVPEPAAVAAERELGDAQIDRDLVVHVRTSSWQVPVMWFALVDAVEREVGLGRAAGPGDAEPTASRGLVYRTPMSRARRRVARALAVLRRAADDGASAGLEELGRWLEQFHPRSVVELDYAGLVPLLSDADLETDCSAADVAEALAALDQGRGDLAVQAYCRVAERMKALQAVETAS